eukprot:jgi/Ulvmu1/1869/UM012_0025.1
MPVGPSPTDLQRKGSWPQCSPRSRSVDAAHGADSAAAHLGHRIKRPCRKRSASGVPSASLAPPRVESSPPRSMTLPSERSRLQEMIYAVALSEAVYRLVDDGPVAAVAHANHILSGVPSADIPPINVQCSLLSVPHRYLVAESKEVIMISFVGTKQIQDLLTDINYWQVPLTTADGAAWPSTDVPDGKPASNVLVHQGFMARSQHIPIKQLYEHARSSGKRLLLCGHSLGGAVATLCTLRLLGMDPEAASHIHCITFACVAIGNPEVMRMVHANGWSHLFQNFILPEDDVVRLALLMQLKGLPSVTREVAAHALAIPGLTTEPSGDPAPDQASIEHPNHQLLQSSLAFLNRFTIDDLTTLPFQTASPLAGSRGSAKQEQTRSHSESSRSYVHAPAAEPHNALHGNGLGATIRPSGGGVRGWNMPFQPHRRRSPALHAVGGRARSSSPQAGALSGRDRHSPRRFQGLRRGRSPGRGSKGVSHAAAGTVGPGFFGRDARGGDRVAAWQEGLARAYTEAGSRSLSAPAADTGAEPQRQVVLERLASVRSAMSDSDGMAVAASAAAAPAERRRRGAAAVAALTAARDRAGAGLAGLWSAAQTGAARFNDHYNVIPSYHPFGLQLYLNPQGVSVGLHSDDADMVSPSSSVDGATHSQPRHPAAERVAGDDLPGAVGDDLEHEVSDLVDRGALLPQQLQSRGRRGKVFHMHRMFNYRHRLLHLLSIMDVLPGPYVPAPACDPTAAGQVDADIGAVGDDAAVDEEQLDGGVVRLAGEIIPELQPSHVEVVVHPVALAVPGDGGGPAGGARRAPWARGARGQLPRQASPRYCDVDVCVRGSGLGFMSAAAVQVAATRVEADAHAAAASATEQCVRVRLPLAVVHSAAMRPGGEAVVSLRSDFAESQVQAHVRVPQCVVLGSSQDAVCDVMHAVAAAAPAEMHAEGAAGGGRNDATPRSWAQALRPMQLLQRLPWRSRPRSLDRAGEAALLEPPPVAACGGVRYVDGGWDFAMRRLSDAATTRSLFELAAVLQQQAWREQRAARRRGAASRADSGVANAFGALVSHVASSMSTMRVAVVHRMCMMRRGAWAAVLHMSALTARGIWRIQMSSGQAHMRMLAVQPRLTPAGARQVAAGRSPSASAPATVAAVPSHTVPTSDDPPMSSDDSTAESTGANGAVRRPRMRIPRAVRRHSARLFLDKAAAASAAAVGDDDAEADDDAGAHVAEFLYARDGDGLAAVRACLDTVLVVEDVQMWRGQRPPLPTRRRRRAVARVIDGALSRGAGVVLALSVPEPTGHGEAFEWLEEVRQMRAAYRLAGREHRVVVLDGSGGDENREAGPPACASLHNAVVSTLGTQGATDGAGADREGVALTSSKL